MIPVVVLPGIIMPASLRYAPLVQHLADLPVIVRELAVYDGDAPPPDYSIGHEVAALAAVPSDRFHIYAHSGGGACALAFTAAYPERVATLAIDEPAADFTPEDRADPHWDEIAAAAALPPREGVAAFMRLQLAPGVPLPPSPAGEPPRWMAARPAGIRAISVALRQHTVDPRLYRAFRGPVLYTHGSLSHPRWLAMRDRLGRLFGDFRAVMFEGLHHLNPSHQAEPARTAALLREHWARS